MSANRNRAAVFSGLNWLAPLHIRFAPRRLFHADWLRLYLPRVASLHCAPLRRLHPGGGSEKSRRVGLLRSTFVSRRIAFSMRAAAKKRTPRAGRPKSGNIAVQARMFPLFSRVPMALIRSFARTLPYGIHPDTRLDERDGADARDLHVLVGVVLVLAHEFHVACAV